MNNAEWFATLAASFIVPEAYVLYMTCDAYLGGGDTHTGQIAQSTGVNRKAVTPLFCHLLMYALSPGEYLEFYGASHLQYDENV